MATVADALTVETLNAGRHDAACVATAILQGWAKQPQTREGWEALIAEWANPAALPTRALPVGAHAYWRGFRGALSGQRIDDDGVPRRGGLDRHWIDRYAAAGQTEAEVGHASEARAVVVAADLARAFDDAPEAPLDAAVCAEAYRRGAGLAEA